VEFKDLYHRFAYHKPPNETVAMLHAAMRDAAYDLALIINDASVDCREKSIAITKVEEAMMWANAAIARAPI